MRIGKVTHEGAGVEALDKNGRRVFFFFFVSSLLSFGAGPYVRLNILCTLHLG